MELQIGVKVIIRAEDDTYLFLKRVKQLQDGSISWDIPGGRIDPTEPVLTALGRELQEETGLVIDLSGARVINVQDIFVKPSKHIVRITYLVNSPKATITLSGEHSDYRYMPLTEALRCVKEPELVQTLAGLNVS